MSTMQASRCCWPGRGKGTECGVLGVDALGSVYKLLAVSQRVNFREQ